MNTRWGVWLKRATRRASGRDTWRYGWAYEDYDAAHGHIITKFQRGDLPKSAYVFMMQEDAEAYALKVALKNPETMGHLEVRLFAVPVNLMSLFREDKCGASATVSNPH